jgi:hypothetical protein
LKKGSKWNATDTHMITYTWPVISNLLHALQRKVPA